MLRYLPRNGRVKAGKIAIGERDVASLDADALRDMRANAVSMVYQDPGRALNPSLTIARQVSEAFEASGASAQDALARTADILKRVRIASPERVMDSYPHQLSGGMQQRVAIAMALACNPGLLILDEPTTGLDATVEAEVLDLIAQLRAELGTAVLFISHNLAVIGRMCDRVGVLYAGKLVEEGTTADVFAKPRHPYTVGLLRCLPREGRAKETGRLDTIPGSLPLPGSVTQGCIFAARCKLADERCQKDAPPPYRIAAAHGDQMSRCHYHERAESLPRATDEAPVPVAPLDAPALALSARNLSKTFRVGDEDVRAVHDVSLDLVQGETLGLVAPDKGAMLKLDGKSLPERVTHRSEEQVKSLQIVFQNPDSALNRAHSVRQLIARSLTKLAALHSDAKEQRLQKLTEAVRLPERYLSQRTRQLSGGLKQRVAIARAFAGDPRVVVCDEPTSALDVSVQAAILNLLADLQRERRVSYVFISHDLHVVRYLSDRIAVLYLGRIMELGAAADVFDGPQHPYTETLLSSVPSIDGTHAKRIRLSGELPSASNPPSGCVFHTRCPRKIGEICETKTPPCRDAGNGHAIHCHIPVDELRVLQTQTA
ncbi:Oligopeptide transport system permease protein OppB [Candidatus Burkholderia verschuerenii]|uniref:Oligopeptide transport system permease protein OppB n=1 Tax=Candidatus Burkholderia verschuerenii TaxID=242163 RepID=A0A0L0M8L5_9BURK|nr:Oligopeptide transport system permease protein OppB [Candidatus Burkholderia verschuerenii]